MYYACILLVLVNVLALSCGLEGLVVIASTVLPRVLVGINAGGVKKRIKDKRYLVDAVVLICWGGDPRNTGGLVIKALSRLENKPVNYTLARGTVKFEKTTLARPKS